MLFLGAAVLFCALCARMTAEPRSILVDSPRQSAAILKIDPKRITLDGLSLPIQPKEVELILGKPNYVDTEWRHVISYCYPGTEVSYTYGFLGENTYVRGRVLSSGGHRVLWLGATEQRARSVLAPLARPIRYPVEGTEKDGSFRLAYRGPTLPTGVDVEIKQGKVCEITLCPAWTEGDEMISSLEARARNPARKL